MVTAAGSPGMQTTAPTGSPETGTVVWGPAAIRTGVLDGAGKGWGSLEE